MPSSVRTTDRGRLEARKTLGSLGTELRGARIASGLSQASVGLAAGFSASRVGRLERAQSSSASIEEMTVLFAILGQRLSVRPCPNGPPLRDVAHARLLQRFRAILPADVSMRTEVPVVGNRADLRAWDALIGAREWSCRIEAETVISDLQATDRRIALKMRDAEVDHVLLLVAGTKRNRRILREFRALTVAKYPLDSRAILAAVRAGRCPRRSGVLLL